MIIDTISDIHGEQPELNGGELLIIAGDCTASDLPVQWQAFAKWLCQQEYRHKIIVSGNHDNYLKLYPDWCSTYIPNCTYLQDSLFEFEGLRIYGSPWTNWFSGVSKYCKAFMETESQLTKHFNKIPENLDILVTHGPPNGILDGTYQLRLGSVSLLEKVKLVKPRHHVFGHIHECGGQRLTTDDTMFYNVACMNKQYDLDRRATRIEI